MARTSVAILAQAMQPTLQELLFRSAVKKEPAMDPITLLPWVCSVSCMFLKIVGTDASSGEVAGQLDSSDTWHSACIGIVIVVFVNKLRFGSN